MDSNLALELDAAKNIIKKKFKVLRQKDYY